MKADATALRDACAKVRCVFGDTPDFHWEIWKYNNEKLWFGGIDGEGMLEMRAYSSPDRCADYIIDTVGRRLLAQQESANG